MTTVLNEMSIHALVNSKNKWTSAFAKIYCSRTLIALSAAKDTIEETISSTLSSSASFVAIDVADGLGVDQPSQSVHALASPKRRWRSAFAKVYCSRTLLSIYTAKYPVKVIVIKVQPDADDFEIEQPTLCKLMVEENLDQLRGLGGVPGVVKAVRSDTVNGIRGDHGDISNRRKAFGSNMYRKPPAKSLTEFILKAVKDPMIFLQVLWAALSLAFGVSKHGLKQGWVDGGSILIAASLAVGISSGFNFLSCQQLNKSQMLPSFKADVVRNGWMHPIPSTQLLVGDVVHLKPGDKVPADGLLLEGNSLQVEKTNLPTGNIEKVNVDSSRYPFVHSGSMVLDGCGRIVVTSVGSNTARAKMVTAKLQDSLESTPLHAELKNRRVQSNKVALITGFIVFAIWMIRHFTEKMRNENEWHEMKFRDVAWDVIGIVITATVIASSDVADGFSLIIVLNLAYSVRSMIDNRALVRELSAIEAIAPATAICMKLKPTTVTRIWMEQKLIDHPASTTVSPNLIKLFHQGIGLNTTQPPSAACSLVWCPLQKAIICWATEEMDMNMKELEETCSILYYEVDSAKRRAGFLMKKNDDETIHLHWKGKSEDILAMCSHYYGAAGIVKAIDSEASSRLKDIVKFMAANGLHCFAFAHKQISTDHCEDEISCQILDEFGLTLLALVGVRQFRQDRIREVVEQCHSIGINIKIVTRDGAVVATAIATECGIIEPDQGKCNEIVEGADFRNYTKEEILEKVENIRVLAGASPGDMLLMVQGLKAKKYVVAVTGGDAADAASLKEAHTGISVGFEATDVAKESSDIVILNDDLVSVVKILKMGRRVVERIRSSTQFQITVVITCLVIDFVTAVLAGEPPNIDIVAVISSGHVPFAALQLLWAKLIFGPLAALAFAVKQPSKELIKHPVDQSPLLTTAAWKNIICLAMYHIAILAILHFKRKAIFDGNDNKVQTMVFNTLILGQLFTILFAGNLQTKYILGWICSNKLFFTIIGTVATLQVVMVEFLSRYADTERLNPAQWLASISIAATTLPLAWAVGFIPVPIKPCLSYLKFWHQDIGHSAPRPIEASP